MKVFRTIGKITEVITIKDDHWKQFEKAGWAEVKEAILPQVPDTPVAETTQAKKMGRPKKHNGENN